MKNATIYVSSEKVAANLFSELLTDTSYTWTEKYESDYINIYYCRVQYTAGKEPGSFYVLRSRIGPTGDHVWLYIDYSNDYGETFTTYFHDLDSIYSIGELSNNSNINAYPNPFSRQLAIELPQNMDLSNWAVLEIYNVQGQRVATQPITSHTISWKPANLSGSIYFIKVKQGNQAIGLKKVIMTGEWL